MKWTRRTATGMGRQSGQGFGDVRQAQGKEYPAISLPWIGADSGVHDRAICSRLFGHPSF